MTIFKVVLLTYLGHNLDYIPDNRTPALLDLY